MSPLKKPVRLCGFTVVDMSHDAEVADVIGIHESGVVLVI